jgi:5,10-methylenetetrahydrofolate reductase
MKNYRILLIGLCLLLSSCALPITYFGDTLSPTNSVDIYYSAHDITKTYKVIGHLTCANAVNQEKVKTQLSAYAKKIGADAIVITGLDGTKDSTPTVVNADALKYN